MVHVDSTLIILFSFSESFVIMEKKQILSKNNSEYFSAFFFKDCT